MATFDLNLTTVSGNTNLDGLTSGGNEITLYRGTSGTIQSRSADTPRGAALTDAGVIKFGKAGSETIRRIYCPMYQGGSGQFGLILGLSISGGQISGYRLIPLNSGGTQVRIDKYLADAYSFATDGATITVNPASGYWFEHKMSGGNAVLSILSTDLSTVIYTTTDSGANPLPLGEYGMNNTGGSNTTAAFGNSIKTTGLSNSTAAPVFSVNPSISPGSGTAGTTLFTATDGTASDTTGYTRRWLLDGVSIGTGTTVTPASAGSLVLEVTATGAGGSTIANSSAVTVSAAIARAQGGMAIGIGIGLAFSYGGGSSTPTPTPSERPEWVAPTRTVSTLAGLYSALTDVAPAPSGEVIGLNPGNYDTIFLARNFSSEVVITSSDPDDRAVVNGAVIRENSGTVSHNMKFTYLDFVGDTSRITTASAPLVELFDGISNITIENCNLTGVDKVITGDWHNGYLITVTNGSNITLNWNSYNKCNLGVSLNTVTDCTINNSKFRNMNNQGGIKLFQCDTVEIDTASMLYFDAAPPPADSHYDAIQIQTSGASSATTDITITNVIVYSGEDAQVAFSQGITSTNNSGGAHRTQNVSITNCHVLGATTQAFFALYNDGFTLTDNVATFVPLPARVDLTGAEMLIQGTSGTEGRNGTTSNNSSTYDDLSIAGMTHQGGNYTTSAVTDAAAIAIIDAHDAANGW